MFLRVEESSFVGELATEDFDAAHEASSHSDFNSETDSKPELIEEACWDNGTFGENGDVVELDTEVGS